MYGNLSTTTATSEINENVESMSRFLTTNRNIELLEPYEGKLSCTVLRGEGGSNALDLPDIEINLFGIRSGTSKSAFTSKVLTLRIQPFQCHSQMPS